MVVPTLDYSHFISGTKDQRQKFAFDLLDSFERTGFAKLKAHTFSKQELNELFGWVGSPDCVNRYRGTDINPRARSSSTSLWR